MNGAIPCCSFQRLKQREKLRFPSRLRGLPFSESQPVLSKQLPEGLSPW